MSRGDRGAFFAIGLGLGTAIALFFFVWAFPWFSHPDKGANYECDTDQKCSEQYSNPDESHFWVRPFYGWIYLEDSLAQWLMAAFGVVATGVSLWAVILVRDTLDQNRAATAAAVKAVGIAQSSYELEVRPVVIVKPIALAADDGSHPFIQVMVANIGRTHALQMEVYAALDMVDWPTTDEDLVLKGQKIADRIFLQPQDGSDFPVRRDAEFSRREIRQIRDGKTKRLGVFGRIVYRDRFDTEYVTPFATSISGGPSVDLILNKEDVPDNMRVRFETIWTKHNPT